MNARVVPIENVVEKVATWNPAKAEGEFDYIDLSAVDQSEKRIVAPNRIATFQAPSRARQLVREGDVIVSTVRPNLNGVAKVTDAHEGMTASTGFCVLRPRSGTLDSSYLFHWIRSPAFVDDMVRKATGASYPAVSDRIIKESEIPLPSLDEQKRIAAILDKADQLRQKRRQAIALLDSLTQSIFLEMFGDPVSNPKGWDCRNLENVVEAVVDCPHSTPRWVSSGKIALRTSNLTRGGWDWSDTRFVSEVEFIERSRRRRVRPRDIVLSREGTVGIAAIVQPNMEVCLGQRLVQVAADERIAVSEYLLHHLLFELDPTRISRVMVGATSQHINVKDLRNLKMMIPPLGHQIEFQRRCNVLGRSLSIASASNEEIHTLFASLQHRAFTGQI